MLSDWQPLESGHGLKLALKGEYTAAAESGRLSIWKGRHLVAQTEPKIDVQPGFPRFCSSGQVGWGRVLFEPKAQILTSEKFLFDNLAENTPAFSYPMAWYRPKSCAWSSDGRKMVVSAAWTGPRGPLPTKVILCNADGSRIATLFEGEEQAPESLWFGEKWVAAGFTKPLIYNFQGKLIQSLDANTPPVRLETSSDEGRLLVHEFGRTTVWDTQHWSIVARWSRLFLDAAMTPDGKHVFATDMDGKLFLAICQPDTTPLINIPTPDPVSYIAIDQQRIVATFLKGEPLRTALLQLK